MTGRSHILLLAAVGSTVLAAATPAAARPAGLAVSLSPAINAAVLPSPAGPVGR